MRRYGFPYEEPHARGGVQAIRGAFAILGVSEGAALLPAMAATLAAVLVAYGCSRAAGLGPGGAALLSGVLAAMPQVAGFAATAFTEPATTLAFLLGAAALLVRKTGGRFALAALGSALGVAHRETSIAIPCALALGLVLEARREGAKWPQALRAAAPAAAALALALAVLRLCAGVFATRSGGDLAGWYLTLPFVPEEVFRDGFHAASNVPPPPITFSLIVHRALAQAPRLVWCERPIAGAGISIVLAHVAAACALPGLRRSATPASHGLAAYALSLYAVKVLFLLFLYEEPGLNARHLAPETAALVLAAGAALGPSRRSAIAGIALLPLLLSVDARVAAERRVERGRRADYSATLCRIADPRPGKALVAYNAYRVTWDRPGTFVVLPPATEPTLDWLAERVPIQAMVLDATEPLVAPSLHSRGHAPGRLGRFELKGRDTSAGVTLLLYEPPTHQPR